jgi:hypothetical protein
MSDEQRDRLIELLSDINVGYSELANNVYSVKEVFYHYQNIITDETFMVMLNNLGKKQDKLSKIYDEIGSILENKKDVVEKHNQEDLDLKKKEVKKELDEMLEILKVDPLSRR